MQSESRQVGVYVKMIMHSYFVAYISSSMTYNLNPPKKTNGWILIKIVLCDYSLLLLVTYRVHVACSTRLIGQRRSQKPSIHKTDIKR